MKYFSLITTKAPNRVFLSIVLGVIAGLLYAAIIPIVLTSIGDSHTANSSLNDVTEYLGVEVINPKIGLLFFAICIAILLTRSLSEIMLAHVAITLAKDVREKYYERITSAPIESLEKVGSSRLIASINIDIPQLVDGARIFPGLLVNCATLFGMLFFLFYLDANILQLVIIAIVVGAICYRVPMLLGETLFRKVRDARDSLQSSIDGLIMGSKELKSDKLKSDKYVFQVLHPLERNIEDKEKKAQTIIRATMNFGDMLSFLVIGIVVFVATNYYAIPAQELVAVVMVLLYIAGPVGFILNAIPDLVVASVSNRKFNQLMAEIPDEGFNKTIIDLKPFTAIHFRQVSYQYQAQTGERGFCVGPIDLTVSRGQVTFIVGSNGSGKSTFSKVMTLHYTPTSGEIWFGDNQVLPENANSCRRQICAIYTDFYLFERLLLPVSEEILQKARKYLSALQLESKVSISDGKFSTLLLSDGQRKRLALLVAFLEDKAVYLFDEWAADQDPVFRKVFYRELLPELKRQNKVVIVISHDDQYFEQADQLVYMEQGVLDKVETYAVSDNFSGPCIGKKTYQLCNGT